MKLNSFINLMGYGFIRLAIRWIKPVVVTVGASSDSFGAVAVGTGKPGINGYFLDPFSKGFPKIIGIVVKTSVVSPGIYVCAQCKSFKMANIAI